MAKILVVDDQRNMRTTLSLMLRGAGHDVSEGADGNEACEMVRGDSYDLVLTDLKMGGRDGIEVLRHTKEASPLTEVIVMTAYGTIESAVEAMRIGAYDYIQKPFSEEELLVKVDRAVEKRTLAGEVKATASGTSSAAAPPSARCSRASCASRRPTRPSSSPARAAPARSSSRARSTRTRAAPIARSSA
jgi:DNA-binding NtrC family response regulator